MSTFEVPVLRVDDVYDHPNADRLSVVKIRGYEAITMKNEDGSHRFQLGELIVYVPEGAVVPQHLLKQYGFWNDEKNIGMLAGSQGNRVKAIRLRGMLSQGLVWKTEAAVDVLDMSDLSAARADGTERCAAKDLGDGHTLYEIVQENDNVAEFFGMVKYEEPIPASMSGSVFNCQEAKFDYDIENIKNFTMQFTAGKELVIRNDAPWFDRSRTHSPGWNFEVIEEYETACRVRVKEDFEWCFLQDNDVEITEKLHGTFCRITWLGDQAPNVHLFGDGRIAIASKGLGAKGLVFKVCEENLDNIYVRTMTVQTDADSIASRFALWCQENYPGARVHLMGEIFGRGVQDLHYGAGSPTFRAFDVAIQEKGMTVFLDAGRKQAVFDGVGVDRVPLLYTGPFKKDVIETLTSGTTQLGGFNIREGVVITAVGPQDKRQADGTHQLRPILKSVSPEYLTRKGGTELQ